MGKKSNKETTQATTTAPDAASQAYIDQLRQYAQQAAAVAGQGGFFSGPQTQSIAQQAAPFFNPFQDQVIGATRDEFDHLRQGAATDAASDATLAGAYGGSRAAVAQGVRQSALDRAEASTVAGLLDSGYDRAVDRGVSYAEQQRQLAEQKAREPLFGFSQGLNFLTQGMGPVGMSSNGMTRETGQKGFGLSDLAGLGLTAYGIYAGSKGGGGGSAMTSAPPTGGFGFAPMPPNRNPGLFG